MNDSKLTPDKIRPINRSRLLLGLLVIGYGVIFGEVYSSIYFSLWLVTHFLVLIGLSLGLLWPALRAKSWPSTAIDAPLLALGLTMASSLLLSPWPRLALEALFLWLSQVLAFYLVVKLMRHNWSDSLLRALMLVTGVIILISLFELTAWYFGVPFVPRFSQGWWEIGGMTNPIPPVWYRLSFMLNNPVVLSAYLVLVIPVAVAFLITTRRAGDQLLIGLFLGIALLIFTFTFARGGWLGLGAGLASLAGLWLWRTYHHFSSRKRLVVISLLAVVNLVVLATGLYFIWFGWDDRSASNAERIAYWQAAIYLYNQYPIVGIGPGLYRWGWRLSPFFLEIRDVVVTAHSIYLNQVAELGTIGGLAGLWLLVAAGLTFWRNLNKTKNRRLWWRRAGSLAGLVGFVAQGTVETFFSWSIILPVIILSAYLLAPFEPHFGFGPADSAEREPKNRGANIFRRAVDYVVEFFRRYAGLTLSILWVICAVLITFYAWPRTLAEQARRAANQEHYERALASIRQSIRLDPRFALYRFEAARWLAMPALADYQAARTSYQDALRLEPAYGPNYANLAAIEWHLGEEQAALHHMLQATQLAPHVPEFWLTLGAYAEESGEDEQALSAYARAILTEPDWVSSNFWQATAWRRDNFEPIFNRVLSELSPLAGSRLQFELHLRTSDFANAETALEDIQKYDADGYLYHLSAGELHLAYHNLSEAFRQAEQAGQLQPNNNQAYLLQAEILLELGRLDQAEQAVKRANFLDQGSTAAAYYILGRIEEARGLPDEAETAYWRGYNPRTFPLDYSTAMYGQLSSLLPLPLLQATTGGPTATRAWFALADLLQKQDRPDEAAEIYQFLLKVDPYLTQAELELATLCQENQAACP